jgi:hypothetical protein
VAPQAVRLNQVSSPHGRVHVPVHAQAVGTQGLVSFGERAGEGKGGASVNLLVFKQHSSSLYTPCLVKFHLSPACPSPRIEGISLVSKVPLLSRSLSVNISREYQKYKMRVAAARITGTTKNNSRF